MDLPYFFERSRLSKIGKVFRDFQLIIHVVFGVWINHTTRMCCCKSKQVLMTPVAPFTNMD